MNALSEISGGSPPAALMHNYGLQMIVNPAQLDADSLITSLKGKGALGQNDFAEEVIRMYFEDPKTHEYDFMRLYGIDYAGLGERLTMGEVRRMILDIRGYLCHPLTAPLLCRDGLERLEGRELRPIRIAQSGIAGKYGFDIHFESGQPPRLRGVNVRDSDTPPDLTRYEIIFSRLNRGAR